MSEPPVKEARETESLAGKLVVVSALRVMLVTLSLGAAYAFLGEHSARVEWHIGLIAVTYAVSLAYSRLIRGEVVRVEILAFVQIAIDSVIASALIFITGGIDSIFAFAYVFVVLGGAMTLFRQGAVLATLSCLLLFAVTVTIQAMGVVPYLEKPEFGRAALSFFMYGLGLSLVAYLGSTLAETVRRTGRELKDTETALEQLEELQAAILRSLPAGVLLVDERAAVEYANEAALGILGYEHDDIVGHALSELVPSIAGVWHQRQVIEGPRARERYEGNFARSDGLSLRLGFSFAPVSSEPGKRSALVVFQDVTDIVRLRRSVERAERLATIGKFAAGLAHEVRNPLASICASIDALEQSLDPPESMQRLMRNVVKESERLDSLITDFLNFARPREMTLETIDIRALVTGVLDVFRSSAERVGVAVETSFEQGLSIDGDIDRLKQVLWNLLKNAQEAMKEGGGKVRVELRSRDNWVDIIIKDTGPGISESALERVFDPFYTTKEGGSGLGLAIAHSIVEAHDGKMFVSTELGRGTEFVVRLPVNRSVVESGELPPDVTGEHEMRPSQLDFL